MSLAAQRMEHGEDERVDQRADQGEVENAPLAAACENRWHAYHRASEREGERERVSKQASEQAAERASERASERDRVAQGRWSESGTLSRRAAAAGLAPDVKFSCGKAQLYFTV